MPFLRDRRDLAGLVLGGWEISGKMRWQSGQYLTADGNTSIGDRRADYTGAEIGLPSTSAPRIAGSTPTPSSRRRTPGGATPKSG